MRKYPKRHLILFYVVLINLTSILTLRLLNFPQYSEPPSEEKTSFASHTSVNEVISPPPTTPMEQPKVYYKIYEIPLSQELQTFIYENCPEELDPEFIMAITYCESNYGTIKEAYSPSRNCIGIMQIYAKYHAERMKRLKVTSLLDDKQNILVGVDYIKELYSASSTDLNKTLIAYNEGLFSESFKSEKSSAYSKKVLSKMNEIKSQTSYSLKEKGYKNEL